MVIGILYQVWDKNSLIKNQLIKEELEKNHKLEDSNIIYDEVSLGDLTIDYKNKSYR